MELIRNLGVRLSKTGNSYQSWAVFKCCCGKEVERQLGHGKRDKSCGCKTNMLISESLIGQQRNYKHGESGTRLYTIWVNMKQRCYNSKTDNYEIYGGRGITICDEWFNSSEMFIKWSLSNGYKEGLQINRINNDGNYEPSNCDWVTAKENCNNRRPLKIILEIANEIRYLWKTKNYTQKELSIKFDVSQSTISTIVNNKRWKN